MGSVKFFFVTAVVVGMALQRDVAASELQEAGTLVMVSGDVHVVHNKENRPVAMGYKVLPGDVVHTGASSFVRILMKDKTLLDLGPSSKIELRKHEFNAQTRIRKVDVMLLMGKIWARVTEKFSGESNYQVTTANLTIGVRGTEFLVEKTENNNSAVTVIDGHVVVENGFNGESYAMLPLDKRTVDGSTGHSVAEKITLADVSKLDSTMPSNAFAPARIDGSSSASQPVTAVAQWVAPAVTTAAAPTSFSENPAAASDDGRVALAQQTQTASQAGAWSAAAPVSSGDNGRVMINQDPASSSNGRGVGVAESGPSVSVGPNLDLDPALQYAYVTLKIIFKE
jgi:hypothetical protein